MLRSACESERDLAIIEYLYSTAVRASELLQLNRFRRTCTADLLNAGMPIEQVQELLGHKSIETTRIYCTINQEAVKHNHKRYMEF